MAVWEGSRTQARRRERFGPKPFSLHVNPLLMGRYFGLGSIRLVSGKNAGKVTVAAQTKVAA